MITDIEELMLACMNRKAPKKRRKYRYAFAIETLYSPQRKKLFKSFTIVKSHIELIPDEKTGKRKKKLVKDDAVRGGLPALYLYMVDEYKGYDG